MPTISVNWAVPGYMPTAAKHPSSIGRRNVHANAHYNTVHKKALCLCKATHAPYDCKCAHAKGVQFNRIMYTSQGQRQPHTTAGACINPPACTILQPPSLHVFRKHLLPLSPTTTQQPNCNTSSTSSSIQSATTTHTCCTIQLGMQHMCMPTANCLAHQQRVLLTTLTTKMRPVGGWQPPYYTATTVLFNTCPRCCAASQQIIMYFSLYRHTKHNSQLAAHQPTSTANLTHLLVLSYRSECHNAMANSLHLTITCHRTDVCFLPSSRGIVYNAPGLESRRHRRMTQEETKQSQTDKPASHPAGGKAWKQEATSAQR